MTSNLPINLEYLLRQRQVEGERIEYKAGWNPDAIMRTMQPLMSLSLGVCSRPWTARYPRADLQRSPLHSK